MTALDTNILVRFLVRDDERQAQAVYKRFRKAESQRERLFVPLLVVLEMIWVLDSVYVRTRDEILEAFDNLKGMTILKFEKEHVIQAMITNGKNTGIELSDLLIALSVKSDGSDPVITFDRKAAKHPLFTLLS
jgi:predicted nucleic-acid-binding protein